MGPVVVTADEVPNPQALRLVDGDVMRCEIGGIGVIENRVVDETPRVEDHAEAAGLRMAARAGFSDDRTSPG